MNAMSTVITDHVVAPSNQPSIRDQTTSSVNPEAPDAANKTMIPKYSALGPAANAEREGVVIKSTGSRVTTRAPADLSGERHAPPGRG
jgi:hypothetical protein